MKKYRVVLIETVNAFDEPVKWYAIQVRTAFFWWVTVEMVGSLASAWHVLYNSNRFSRPEKVIKVVG